MSAKILFQFDVDAHPSSFDGVVAIDAGVDHLFQYGNVDPSNVEGLVHGGMFTRGGDDLKNTAIFIGGNDVGKAEALLKAVQKAFFGPVRVSVMLDASGCNTTAAAAVASASKHTSLSDSTAVVLGGTGPVGRRVAQMLAREGSHVILTSRSLERAESACDAIRAKVNEARLEAAAPDDDDAKLSMLQRAQIIFACGAAGVELMSEEELNQLSDLKVAIDLNAVPPAGIGGIAAFDKAKPLGEDRQTVVYGPIGVGGLKMRTHKAAIAKLFQSNDQVVDADEVYELTRQLI
ncbi:NADP-dependent methylenetetrahydromethanopterin/methylenetetrahydrofolate dehydrogenase [Neorhodopirellula pilleata]|uniref:Bifunctional protein MdtA n=1 Tax=Neorhodopirellula pilleata TaxID=2714738 RepID=A0A5C6AWE5_9BACT|nr:NADP-dependent methylenetetrahydromethanopterin/methylenetetrahydrofolate dehydrogenase [Neorhodopirellula pilleata]TWU04070.1 Bifunctional protein MdtA [Neorhodopirellula pilleata]